LPVVTAFRLANVAIAVEFSSGLHPSWPSELTFTPHAGPATGFLYTPAMNARVVLPSVPIRVVLASSAGRVGPVAGRHTPTEPRTQTMSGILTGRCLRRPATPDLVELTRRFFEAANGRNFGPVMGVFAADAVWDTPQLGTVDEARAAAVRPTESRG
jgi:hypothetical protein